MKQIKKGLKVLLCVFLVLVSVTANRTQVYAVGETGTTTRVIAPGETEATAIWVDQAANNATSTINGKIWEDATESSDGANTLATFDLGGKDTYGQPYDLTDNVTVPGFPTEGDQPTFTDVTPEGTIDVNTPGEYIGKVEVTYPDGSKEIVDVPVIVGEKPLTDAEKYNPVAEKETVQQGTPVNLTDNVTVPGFPADGPQPTYTDVTPVGAIDINTPGDYTGQVQVTYPDGTSEVINVPVTVTPTPPTDAEKYNPVATTETVEQGGTYDLTDNVTVPDYPGDPNALIYTDVTPVGDIDVNTPGTYTGQVQVTYPDGSKEVINVPVTVTEKPDTTAPEAPVINPVTEGDTTIGGTGEPGATVTVTLPDGTEITAVVDDQGNWTATVPTDATPLKPGDVITATQTDPAGNTSEEGTTTVVAKPDTTAPDAPIVDPITEGDTEITGEGEPNAEVEITLPDGTTITTTVDEDGTWTATVPEDATPLKPGDPVIVNQTDEAGNRSDDKTVYVGVIDKNPIIIIDPETGIRVEIPWDAFSCEVLFHVDIVERTTPNKLTEAYDIYFTCKSTGQRVVPVKAVTITIPFRIVNTTNLEVFHEEADMSRTPVPFSNTQKTATFTATDFSVYILTSDKPAGLPNTGQGSELFSTLGMIVVGFGLILLKKKED